MNVAKVPPRHRIRKITMGTRAFLPHFHSGMRNSGERK